MEIKVKTREGESQSIEVESGRNLMQVLSEDFDVAGTCGGSASCGTCHIYLSSIWAPILGEQTEDESYMLEALADMVEVQPGSRLACQITLCEEHSGLQLELAPEA